MARLPKFRARVLVAGRDVKKSDKATLNSNLCPPWGTCPLCLHLWPRQAQVINTHGDLFRPLHRLRMSRRLWSKNQQNRLFVISMFWAGMKRFHLQPGRYKMKKQTTNKTNSTFQGSKANSASEWMTEGIMVNRNRLFILPTYYKNFWKLKDKWPHLLVRRGL